MDSNHDIVPTLRMFNGVMMDQAADEIERLRAELASRPAADESAKPVDTDELRCGQRLATSIWERCYRDAAPHWKPLDDVTGVLTQIDNMVSGLTRFEPASTASKEAKPSNTVALADLLIREICETDPADPNADDTVCIGLDDLRLIIETCAIEAENATVASKEAVTLSELAALLPGTYYMDLPDGGDVPVFEQIKRMADDARKWRSR